jgi:hypothetical protein
MAKRPQRFGTRSFVHFRTDAELVDQIDQIVAESRAAGHKGTTRSSVARTLIRSALDADPTGSETREVLARVYQAAQMAMNRLVNDATEKLPDYLDEAMVKLEGGDGAPAE